MTSIKNKSFKKSKTTPFAYESSYTKTSRVTNLPIEIVFTICSFVMETSHGTDDMNWRSYIRSIWPDFIFPKKVNGFVKFKNLPVFDKIIGFKLCDMKSFDHCICKHFPSMKEHYNIIYLLSHRNNRKYILYDFFLEKFSWL